MISSRFTFCFLKPEPRSHITILFSSLFPVFYYLRRAGQQTCKGKAGQGKAWQGTRHGNGTARHGWHDFDKVGSQFDWKGGVEKEWFASRHKFESFGILL